MKTVFKKTFALLLVSALGISLVFAGAVLIFMDALYYETNERGLLDAAKNLQPLLPENLADWISGQKDAAYRFTLIAKDGTVLADSDMDPKTSENHRGRPEVEAALAGGEGVSRRNSASLGMDYIYAALPLYKGGEVQAVFRLARLVPEFSRRVAPAAPPFLILAGLLVIAASAGIYFFSRSLSRALGGLVCIAEAAAASDTPILPGIFPPLVPDIQEFKTLETALRGMAAELSRRVETARAESARLEAILNGMSEAVFAADGRLALTLANPKARAVFGIEAGPGIHGVSLLAATHSTELEEAARWALAGGEVLETQLKLCGAGGQKNFQVLAAPLAAGEEAEGVVIVMNDVTRLVRLEQVRKDFAANVSHELRTPIQIVKGFSENLLDSSLVDTEQIRRFAQIIQKNAQAMENLVTDLLTLVSLEDGAPPRPAPEDAELAPLLEEAAASVKLQAEKKNISLKVKSPAELRAPLHCGLLVQALINLLDNAVKYSPEGSRVTLSAGLAGGNLVIEVRDEGIGIPPEHIGRIFERFYRVDRARSRDAGGTGLGLSIVRHIALVHNGRVEAESHAGEGSCFRLILPPGREAPGDGRIELPASSV